MGEVKHTPDRIWIDNFRRHDGYISVAGASAPYGGGVGPQYLRATAAREAAEDLVEALEMLVHLVSILPPSMDVPDSPLAKARAAIAKAKGGAA